MRFAEYQDQIAQFVRYGVGDYVYTTLGLAGEAGEVANKVKKILRDSDGALDDDSKRRIADELGDTLWYLTRTAVELGYSLEEIAAMNIQKLTDRNARGTIQGSGDIR